MAREIIHVERLIKIKFVRPDLFDPPSPSYEDPMEGERTMNSEQENKETTREKWIEKKDT